MDDVEQHLSTRELAELLALADGSLPADRRAAVEAKVAASPDLAALVERQRRAVGAIGPLAEEPVPASLRGQVDALRPRAPRPGKGRRLVPRLALGAASVLVLAAVALVISLGGAGSQPTVADAAQLATQPPTGPPPGRSAGNGAALGVGIDGVSFPNLQRSYGWRPVGVRRDRLDGHEALVVFYAKGPRRLAYVVVSGHALGGASGYAATSFGGVAFRLFDVDGRPAVTWQRHGHTCVLTGSASPGELLALASWRAASA